LAELSKKITTETLLEQIPVETCWARTAKMLTAFFALRGEKIILPILGKGEGIVSPIWGWEKWLEILYKIWAEAGKKFLPQVTEMLNIPIKDAIDANNLVVVAGILTTCSEWEYEQVKVTKEKAVIRTTKCAWMERYKEFEVAPEFRPCHLACQGFWAEGFKEINPKIIFKFTKALPKNNMYCEWVIEFKEE
jgi:hypothetical protein